VFVACVELDVVFVMLCWDVAVCGWNVVVGTLCCDRLLWYGLLLFVVVVCYVGTLLTHHVCYVVLGRCVGTLCWDIVVVVLGHCGWDIVDGLCVGTVGRCGWTLIVLCWDVVVCWGVTVCYVVLHGPLCWTLLAVGTLLLGRCSSCCWTLCCCRWTLWCVGIG